MSKQNKKHFDIIVIGNNWTGLSLASSISKNKKVALINSFENKNAFQASEEFSGDFDYLPKKENSIKNIEWFAGKHNLSISPLEKSVTPMTIDSGKLVQFLGFGDRDGKSIDSLTWYNESEALELNSKEIKTQLTEAFSGEIFDNCEVTELHIKENSVETVTLNGQKKISAEQIIFCEPPNKLLSLIDHKDFPGKIKQKITKIKPLSCLQIIYKHSSSFQKSDDLHFLMGNKEDFEPCLGYFWKKDDQQFSQWMQLMPSDLTEDIEKVGSNLKNIKRQIKRAYPEFFESVDFEKVIVKDQSHGFIDLDFKEFGMIKGINNLLCASPLFSKENDLFAAIELSQKLDNHPFLNASISV